MESIETVKTALTIWNRDKKIWIYAALISAAFVAFVVVAGLILFALVGSAASSIMSGGNPLAAIGSIISGLLLAVFVFGILFILAIIVFYFIYAKILIRGMELYGIKSSPFGIGKLFKTIALIIASFFASLLSVYELKFLAAGVAGIVSVGVGFLLIFLYPPIGSMLIQIGMLLIMVYFFIVVHNFLRLSMSDLVYLQNDVGIFKGIKMSWNLTKDNAMSIWLVSLIGSTAISFLYYIGYGIVNTIIFPFTYVGLEIVYIFLFFIFTLILISVVTVAQLMIKVGIYANLVKEKGHSTTQMD